MVRIISVSFEIYGYLPISPIGRGRVNVSCHHHELAHPKSLKAALEMQKGGQFAALEIPILFRCRFNQFPKVVICLRYRFGIRDKDYDFG